MQRELTARVDLAPGAVRGPDGGADDLPAACAAYERSLADAGGAAAITRDDLLALLA